MVRGCIATSRCRRRRLPPDGCWPLAMAELVSLTCILEEIRVDVFPILYKAAWL